MWISPALLAKLINFVMSEDIIFSISRNLSLSQIRAWHSLNKCPRVSTAISQLRLRFLLLPGTLISVTQFVPISFFNDCCSFRSLLTYFTAWKMDGVFPKDLESVNFYPATTTPTLASKLVHSSRCTFVLLVWLLIITTLNWSEIYLYLWQAYQGSCDHDFINLSRFGDYVVNVSVPSQIFQYLRPLAIYKRIPIFSLVWLPVCLQSSSFNQCIESSTWNKP